MLMLLAVFAVLTIAGVLAHRLEASRACAARGGVLVERSPVGIGTACVSLVDPEP